MPLLDITRFPPASVSSELPGATRNREQRAIDWARAVTRLLEKRPDLAGVYSPADVTAESVRWSA